MHFIAYLIPQIQDEIGLYRFKGKTVSECTQKYT